MTSTSNQQKQFQKIYTREHMEPEKPLVYEPPDLYGRKHVEKVAGEYRIREDQCLADKLQSEEFEYHFGKNKSERFLGMIDIHKAKEIYLKEVEESGLLSKDELKKICKDDKFLAEEVNKRLAQEIDLEAQRKQAVEMQDEEFARYLEAKERQKHDEERKKRLQRRIAQDKAEAERLQRRLDEETQREEKLAKGMKGLSVKSPQKGGWSIDCEVGASLGDEKMQKDLQQLKDEEISRNLQLQEVELEKKRVEEEKDRRMAMKLQKQEAEEYHRREREKHMRRTQSERRSVTEEISVPNEKLKRIQSVGAKERPAQNDQIFRERERTHTTSARPSNHQESCRDQNEVNSRHVEESLYLQAVDSPHSKEYGDARKRTKPNAAATVEQQRIQPRYQDSTQLPDTEYMRKSNGNRSNRDTQNFHGVPEKIDQSRKLIDDQNVLRQQAKSIEQTQSGSRQSRHRSSVKSRNREEETTWDLEVSPVTQARQPRRNIYDTPEENNRIQYDNVARSLDPTYQTIGPPSKLNGQLGILETEQNVADVRPVPVIQNVKRPSKEDQKKKKKWFSK